MVLFYGGKNPIPTEIAKGISASKIERTCPTGPIQQCQNMVLVDNSNAVHMSPLTEEVNRGNPLFRLKIKRLNGTPKTHADYAKDPSTLPMTELRLGKDFAVKEYNQSREKVPVALEPCRWGGKARIENQMVLREAYYDYDPEL